MNLNLNLKNRSLFSLDELSAREFHGLLGMARELGQARRTDRDQPRLRGKRIALLFKQAAARSPGALETAADEQGATLSLLGPEVPPLGAGDALRDTAHVLGRLYDAIECRGFAPATVRELARHAGVPVYDGLTRPFHPTQVLADGLTMQSHGTGRALAQLSLAYVGDARPPIGDSLLQGAAMLGLDFRIGAPRPLWPPRAMIHAARQKAEHSGARLRLTESAAEAVQGADFIYTNTWAEPSAALQAYRVDAALLRASGNPAVKLLHGQAERHGAEVSDEVFASPACLVADQAANRLHAIMALLVATLA